MRSTKAATTSAAAAAPSATRRPSRESHMRAIPNKADKSFSSAAAVAALSGGKRARSEIVEERDDEYDFENDKTLREDDDESDEDDDGGDVQDIIASIAKHAKKAKEPKGAKSDAEQYEEQLLTKVELAGSFMHKLQEDYKREMEQILKASTNFMTKSASAFARFNTAQETRLKGMLSSIHEFEAQAQMSRKHAHSFQNEMEEERKKCKVACRDAIKGVASEVEGVKRQMHKDIMADFNPSKVKQAVKLLL